MIENAGLAGYCQCLQRRSGPTVNVDSCRAAPLLESAAMQATAPPATPATTSRTALVTGASSGIGAAFAEALAQQGHQLVLTARRADRLEALATRLRSTHGVPVHVLPADLADPGACDALLAQLQAAQLQVDVLVNNAGYGVPGSYLSARWSTHADFLQVLVTSVAQLTHLLLPGMQQRRYGRIVNVASLAGLVPGVAGHTLYPAAKAFLVKFSESLHAEVSARGVFVSALCPGFTWSEFHDVTGTRAKMNAMPPWMWMTAEDVVAEGLAAVQAGRPVCVPGRVNRAVATLTRLLPPALARRLVQRRSGSFRDSR